MQSPRTVKALAITAFVLCIIGLCLQLLAMAVAPGGSIYFIGLLLWICYAVSAFWGYRLSSYPLFPEEFTKVSWYMLGLCVGCVLALFTGVMIGMIVALALLAAMYSLKSNYDDWLRNKALEEEAEAHRLQAIKNDQVGEVLATDAQNSSL